VSRQDVCVFGLSNLAAGQPQTAEPAQQAPLGDVVTRDPHVACPTASHSNCDGRLDLAWRKMPTRIQTQRPPGCPRSRNTGPATDYVRSGILRFFGKTRTTAP